MSKPDTKFNTDGLYHVNLLLDPEEDSTQKFVARLDEEYEKALEAIKEEKKLKKLKEGSRPYSVDDETGKVRLKFNMKAIVRPKGKDEFEQKPGIVDAKKKPINVNIGGGSIIKVAFEPVPYYNAAAGSGVSLRLKAVQVIELVEYAGGDYGFDEEEGYESSDEAADETTSEDLDTDF
mgnify:CR=1 FL=1